MVMVLPWRMLHLEEEVEVSQLKTLFDSIWVSESVPDDWENQILIPLHKKGSRTTCDNYRGIALLSIAILNRLKPRAEQLLRESICGSWHGRGCTDQLFSVRLLMEKARIQPAHLHLIYRFEKSIQFRPS